MRVLVTGSESMVGKALLDKIEEKHDVYIDRGLRAYDLLKINDAYDLVTNVNPDVVIMLAGVNGSLKWNLEYPSAIFNQSMIIGLNTLEACISNKVKKIIFPISSCAYRPDEELCKEDSLFDDNPHESVACHGWAKRMVAMGGIFMAQQHGIDFTGVVAQNSFGEHDRFNERGKVVSGLIRRFVDAKESNSPSIFIYGDGSVKRELLYAKDFAEGLVQIMENYDSKTSGPIINLTPQKEISIKELAEKISHMIGYKGKIIFGDSSQNGQLRRRLCGEKMNKHLNIEFTPLDIALKSTIDWYINEN